MSSAKFWDKTAEKYAKHPMPNESVYEQKLEMTQRYLNPNSVVLEIACGTGTTALRHAPVVKHIDAWDISQNMLAIAKEKQKAQALENIAFHCADVTSCTLAIERYDMVMAHSILHLIGNRKDVLQKLNKALKPGGVFVSSTACLGNKMKWLALIAKPLSKLGFWPDVFFFTSKDLEVEIEKAGFKIEESWLPDKAIAHFFIARKIVD